MHQFPLLTNRTAARRAERNLPHGRARRDSATMQRRKGLTTKRTPFPSFHASPKVPVGQTWKTGGTRPQVFKSPRPRGRPPIFRKRKAGKPETFAGPEPQTRPSPIYKHSSFGSESARVKAKAFNQSEQRCRCHAYYGRKFAGTLRAGRKRRKTNTARLPKLTIMVKSPDLS